MVFEKHIFICTNKRSPSNLKDSCGDGGMAVRIAFVKELKKRGLKNNVRANKAGCLDACSLGSVVVIYPAGIWYKRVTPEDVPEIVEISVIGDGLVDRLRISNTEFDSRK